MMAKAGGVAALHESAIGPERSPRLAAFESGVGGI